MRIERRHTTAGQSPYSAIPFRSAVSEIRNPDGSIVFRLEGIEVPEAWSQVASDVLAQKYFRKAGVPAAMKTSRGERRSLLPLALGSRRGRAGEAAGG
jgi:ribonucleoside-diphosphate reductase alpha chain